jgi:type I restriction enzyme M protein
MNSEIKRHIDAARQVLVGVVPNPSAQIEQITNALIYKFMDDMDQASVKAGGEASFFVGDLERYAWSRIMDSRLGNQERMNLYAEALTKFSEAKQLPPLFRGVFKSAFLPYRDPRVLDLFLREINYFDYDHSEELGEGYEYLLSIMSSQGDAGQFRTPRHIIDFIVDVVNPTKDDRILDPACGTGGFLVSAYRHILEQHDGKDDTEGKEKPLTPDEKKRLTDNFEGYDIDPTMVRIAQVNMYLHQFKNPKIYQYDTLSSEERWKDKFDVVLANPPFMSPKGGINPHSKFSVKSTRSEVLFVDYIMNHLRPDGRAGIIVPEGIIFQSGTAFKELRKNIVSDGLVAVVSLPSGVFNPYSGVKTSVLFFDNELAKTRQEVLFVKVENDGFDLGAQRREIKKNDLPEALEILNKWRVSSVIPANAGIQCLAISKEKIAENGDHNLSGDRYRVATDYTNAKWPMVELGEVIERMTDSVNPIVQSGETVYVGLENIESGSGEIVGEVMTEFSSIKSLKNGFRQGDILYGKLRPNLNKVWLADRQGICSTDIIVLRPRPESAISGFLASVLRSTEFNEKVVSGMSGASLPRVNFEHLAELEIPLPPLEIQEQIVAELDGYAGMIAGAKQIATNWKPKIDIDPSWEKVKLGEVVNTITPSHKIQKSRYLVEGKYPIIDQSQEEIAGWTNDSGVLVNVSKPVIIFGDHTCAIKYSKNNFAQGADGIKILITSEKITPEFLYYYLLANPIQTDGYKRHYGKLVALEIPLPPIDSQKQIVEKIEAERALVESAKKLIDIYEQKTKSAIAKLWEE